MYADNVVRLRWWACAMNAIIDMSDTADWLMLSVSPACVKLPAAAAA